MAGSQEKICDVQKIVTILYFFVFEWKKILLILPQQGKKIHA